MPAMTEPEIKSKLDSSGAFIPTIEVAKMMGVSINTVLSLIHNGKLDAINTSGTVKPSFRVRTSSVREFLKM
ncbi:MAG TPA: helix-turn-helix domain-containing protein [Methylomirabilota bacterium]|nr:helix-turn-helix domain-containing protein [Methylomirabilota bacterium]